MSRARCHTCLLAVVFCLVNVDDPLVAADSVSAETPSFARQAWAQEWAETQNAIAAFAISSSGVDPRDDPHMLDSRALLWPTDYDPLEVELRRARALVKHLRMSEDEKLLDEAMTQLDAIEKQAKENVRVSDRKSLYMQARAVRRKVALSNPLLDFETILVVTGNPLGGAVQGHIKGRSAQRGELFELMTYRTGSPQRRPVLKDVRIANGRNRGMPIEDGAHLSLDLSFDGRKLLFDWCAKRPPGDLGEDSVFNPSDYTPDNTFNIYTYDLVSGELRQLTDTRYNDGFPCWLPDGRIAFVSERRGSYVRCHPAGPPDKPYNRRSHFQPCCALYSMKADGSDIVPLSWHETSEVFPRVTNDGRIVYTRWDYIDRDFNAGHSIWFCMPDGRDPRSPHGNYPRPHNAMDVNSVDFDREKQRFRDRRVERPWTEFAIRPIPNSHRFIAVASIHHSSPKGELVLIDPQVSDDYAMAQVKRITSAALPTESPDIASEVRKQQEFPYAWPWPLSEDFYLVTHLPTKSLVLLDRFGNRDVIYRGNVLFAIPRKPRRTPPVIPTQTFQGERTGLSDHRPATIAVMNVYESDVKWPEGTKITALRVVQIFPRPWSSPFERVGDSFMHGTINRMSLGTVPVEEDGSAYFEAPVECEIYFQALDERGLAVQSMRSGTYVHPGERMTCVGCHEDKWTPPAVKLEPLALQRAPSKLMPEVRGVEPVNYYRLVKPVLEAKCLPCHQKEQKGLRTANYRQLEPYSFYFHGAGGGASLQPLHGGHRTIPGHFGARASRMGQALLDELHQGYLNDGKFTKEDMRRITLWLDLNSLELGSASVDPEDQAIQRRGGIVWPKLDFDPDNPQRLEVLEKPEVTVPQNL